MIAVSAAAQNFPGERVSGDAWRIDNVDPCCRIAVIDGLGHGVAAAAAAATAVGELAIRPELGPADALRACHNALRSTRGAAMTVVWLDLAARQFACAGVGNVDVVLWQGGRAQRISTDRGIVGATIPSIHPFESKLAEDWLLIVHTDGVSSRFAVEPLLRRLGHRPQELADEILRQHGRDNDDATVVVVSPAIDSEFEETR